jgi:protein-S-isoprenylcysteine O-methyltransferase Ste14
MEQKRKIVPPVYLLLTLVLMWLLTRYFPVYQFIDPPAAYSGIILVLFGITIAAISAGLFIKAETGLVPFAEATVLITGGLFRYTRNPMYLGMVLMLLGVALLLGNVATLCPIPLFFLVIRNHFVLGEERFLEAAFAQQYLDYKSKVRRWL